MISPDLSVTDPFIVPVTVCATTGIATRATSIARTTNCARRRNMFPSSGKFVGNLTEVRGNLSCGTHGVKRPLATHHSPQPACGDDEQRPECDQIPPLSEKQRARGEHDRVHQDHA